MKRNYINKIKKMTTAIFIIIMILGQTVTVNAVENIEDTEDNEYAYIEEKQEEEKLEEKEKENNENAETEKNEMENVNMENQLTETE